LQSQLWSSSRNRSDSNRCRPGAKCDCVSADNATGWLAGCLAESQIRSPWTLARAANDAARTSWLPGWPCSMPPALITGPGSGTRPCQLPQPTTTLLPAATRAAPYLLGHLAVALLRLSLALTRFWRPALGVFMRLHLCCVFMLKVRTALQQRRRQLTQFKYAGSLYIYTRLYLYTYVYCTVFGGTANH